LGREKAKALPFPGSLSPHIFATLMLLVEVHAKIVSEMLEHSIVAFTLDTYTHVVPGLQEVAARAFDESLKMSSQMNV